MRHVSALFEDHQSAAEALRLLKEQDFWDREITVIASPDAGADRGARRAIEQASGKGGAWVGSALGAAAAGLGGLMSIALIPAVPLLMAGGAAAGAAAGNLLGSTGLTQEQLNSAEGVLKNGGVLIVVHQETDERAGVAKDLLTQAGSREVAVGAD